MDQYLRDFDERDLETYNLTADECNRVYTVYRPPSTCPREFIQSLDNYLTNIQNPSTDFCHILIGDINIDISKPKDDIPIEYLNVLYSHGFSSYINNTTREEN
ncbi:hypothetical protein NQ317_002614 [Molorchus minor]|uniref:Uncharacterized protein n=1 Tax=Molorchus minor TaxID=1323400 RepID=A0ABQ9JTJ4_9CUCU|nr:hypothetical protein NQ317_002614 [Molorchus minor]